LPSPSQAPSISLSPSQAPSDSCGSTSLSPSQCGSTSVRGDCVIPSPGPTATFNTTLGAPKCDTQAVCDSGELLRGRESLGPELNQPNTIELSCGDGYIGTYLVDESVQQITVSSVGGGVLQEGSTAQIDVQVWRYSTYSKGYVLYTADANSSPSWTLIGEIPWGCPSGCTSYSFEFTLCPGPLQAVRVIFGYNVGDPLCFSGVYRGSTDIDDLIFTVAPGTTDANSGDAIIDNVPDH
jgi:hypothetical protein